MPARIARSNTQNATSRNARPRRRQRHLDAFAIAAHQAPEKIRMRAGRLGEFLDDQPRQKRRRVTDGSDEEKSEDDEDSTRAVKRRKPVAHDEDVEEGSDSEGNRWTLGGIGDDDEDSDLDSDEAFGESDEDRFEGFVFRGSSTGNKGNKRQKKRNKNADGNNRVDLNESEDKDAGEDDDGDFGDEGVDLATMLDDQDDDVPGGKDSTSIGAESDNMREEDDGSEPDSSNVENDSNGDEDESDDGADEERVARLRDRLEALDENVEAAGQGLRTTGASALSVEDLLADLDPSVRKHFSAAIKTKRRSEAPRTLTVPLPKRQQDKFDREIASQKAKEQLDRWRDTVIQNRRAEFLTFPLRNPDETGPAGKDRFLVNHEPRNELEENIRKIMEESGMASKAVSGQQNDEEEVILKAEELGTNKLPIQDVIRRRAELRRARELLFREEIKAKRIAKIKSKAYRRVHRKERTRQAQEEQEALEAAGLGGKDEDEREKSDRYRAEERMSTKHRDSKWSKSVKSTNRTVWDEEARSSVLEQARRKEELKRRIAGENIGDNAETEVSSGDEDEDEADANLFRLKTLDREGQNEDGKGLQNMKFMRAADERRRLQNEEDIEQLKRELAVQEREEMNDAGSTNDIVHDQGLGRANFGPKSIEKRHTGSEAKRPEMEEADSSNDSQDDDEGGDVEIVTERSDPRTGQQRKGSARNSPRASGRLAKNPMGRLSTRADDPNKQDNTTWLGAIVGENENESWLSSSKASKKEQQRRRAANDVAIVETHARPQTEPKGKVRIVATGGTKSLTKESQSLAQKSPVAKPDSWPLITRGVPFDDDHSDENAENAENALRSAKPSYHTRAFAGDDVEAAFRAEKDDVVASENEKEISNHLPGWGSWTGDGLSKSMRRVNARQKHNPLWKYKVPGSDPKNRKDAKLENVIVSEKAEVQGGGKKSKMYLASSLPHGFEQKAQYERSLRVPVGPEWTTKETFQRSTRPRVVVNKGVIEAIEKPLI